MQLSKVLVKVVKNWLYSETTDNRRKRWTPFWWNRGCFKGNIKEWGGGQWGLEESQGSETLQKQEGRLGSCETHLGLPNSAYLMKLNSYHPTETGRLWPNLQVLAGTNSKFFWQPWVSSGRYLKGVFILGVGPGVVRNYGRVRKVNNVAWVSSSLSRPLPTSPNYNEKFCLNARYPFGEPPH